ncbi:MAG: class I SAM-dependent methyltransferase, partial [Nitrospinota bacterium]|nr:class I SAM-dependent methyltransferase [Nitrospinota bacterium]
VASIVGDKGSVVGMDVAERMLDVARSRARAHGLKNLEFHACDVGALPFQDDNFDVATARFCVMLVPNASRALEEIIRVLKPGANFTASVWADPSRNVCLTIAMKILREFVEMSKPAPNAPGLFSQSKPGNLIAKMKEVGFIHTSEETIQIEFSFPSLEFFIANRTEMAPAIRAVLEMLDAPTRALAIEKLAEEGRKYQQPDGSIKFSGEAMIVSGIKGNAQQPSGNC